MRALIALLVLAALAVTAHADEDLSLVELQSGLPSLPAPSAHEAAVIERLHSAAGEWADAAIAEAQADLPSQSGSLLEASSGLGLHSKWDDSVPEIHLHTAVQPEDRLVHGLELVDHIEGVGRPELTDSRRLAAAFPRGPSILGEDAAPVFLQNTAAAQAQAQAKAAAAAAAQTAAQTAAQGNSATHAVSVSESEAKADVMTLSELKQMMELQGMSQQEIDQYMENLGTNHVEADATTQTEAEAEQTVTAEADAESEAHSAVESLAEAEMDAENAANMAAEAEAEAESMDDVSAVEVDADTETEADAETEAVTELHSSNPEQLQEAAESEVTPVHSAAYERRLHPALREVRAAAADTSNNGYELPAFIQTAAHAHATTQQQDPAFNPQSVQLGPSKDAYGYVPMTGAEFLAQRGPQPTSLAQVSMQMQHQQASWLPPPIPAQATPNFVVGMGGLQVNRQTGPYAGQYGVAAGGVPVPTQQYAQAMVPQPQYMQ